MTNTVRIGEWSGATTHSHNLIVDGGTFDLATTVADAMTSVTNVSVATGGTFAFASTAATPFGEGTNTIMRMEAGSALAIPDGLVVPVQRLFRDGDEAPPGDYTGEGTIALSFNYDSREICIQFLNVGGANFVLHV